MKKKRDFALIGISSLCALVTIVFLVWVLGFVCINGLSNISWDFLTKDPSQGGIFPQIITTVYMILITVAISTPVGICAAIYLHEYAKPGKIVNIIRFAVECLSGIPSIIYGLFGMIFFVTQLQMGYSLKAGALTLSIMNLPLIIRTTEEALRTVPKGFREGSFALGATKLRTITKLVLPTAVPGILSGVILSIGRIVGESAALYLTAGMVPRLPQSIDNSGRTLTVHLYLLLKEGGYEQAFATAFVLIVLVAIFNFIAYRLAGRINKKARG